MKNPVIARVLVAIACGITLVAPAAAQTSSPRTGDWVLVETANAIKMEGRLIKLDGDSLVFAPDETTNRQIAVARTSVTNMWVSVGRHRQTWQGLMIGLVGGGAAGALIGAVTFKPCVSQQFLGCLMAPETAGQAALMGGAVGGFFGTIIGGIAGFATKRHTWEVAGVPTTVGVAPARGGAVTLSLRLAM